MYHNKSARQERYNNIKIKIVANKRKVCTDGRRKQSKSYVKLVQRMGDESEESLVDRSSERTFT